MKKLITILLTIATILYIGSLIFAGIIHGGDWVIQDGKTLPYSKLTGIITGVSYAIVLTYIYMGFRMLSFQPTKPVKYIRGTEASVFSILVVIALFVMIFLLSFVNIGMANSLV
ncbi:hypothetical protein RJG79_04845 [Mycoplasmatota bacterium WC44]